MIRLVHVFPSLQRGFCPKKTFLEVEHDHVYDDDDPMDEMG